MNEIENTAAVSSQGGARYQQNTAATLFEGNAKLIASTSGLIMMTASSSLAEPSNDSEFRSYHVEASRFYLLESRLFEADQPEFCLDTISQCISSRNGNRIIDLFVA